MTDATTGARELDDKINTAKAALQVYQNKLQAAAEKHGDLNQSFKEIQQVEALGQWFEKLEKAKTQELDKIFLINRLDFLDPNKPIGIAISKLISTAGDLHDSINGGLYERIKNSQTDYKVSFGIVTSTSVLAVLMMAGLLRFFYRSVGRPIRDLELGVGRVAKGDFEHRIEVHSGDEIEDLAKAYNDMTERLRDMYRDLAQQVNERSRQLVRSERLAGVGFLAAGVAHEINNPLASIAFCGEALERRLSDLIETRSANGKMAPADTQEREIISKYLKMIQEEAFRCKTITSKLLEFSRGGERRREPTDIGDLVQAVLDMVQHLPCSKGKEVIFEPQEKITAWVNGQEVQQVFLNLVVNALESMEEGGRLAVSQRQKDGMVEMVFKDTGCGMSDEVLENIFEPFFTRSRTGKGTGLGLSISHRIITQHGGEVEANSGGPNQGSTFTVRLPHRGGPNNQENEPENLDPETEFLKLSNARRERKAA